ncbi:MAG: DUF4376 domain-containing protein [Pseudomonadota bacterium]
MITNKDGVILAIGTVVQQGDSFLCEGALYPMASCNAYNVDMPAWVRPGDLYVKSQFTKPLPTAAELAAAKAEKNDQINAWRVAANSASFQFAGKAFSVDELSYKDIMSMNGAVTLIGGMPPDWIGEWKAIDNTFIPIQDKATWIAFYLAMINQGQGNFLRSQQLKEALASASTLQQIAAITW